MDVLHTIVKIGIYVIMAVSLFAAVSAVSLPNIFHAALALIVGLIGIAGVFIALKAEFLAVVQILLYVGAVMTLVIFSIMMTENISDKTVRSRNNLSLPALVGCAAILSLLVNVLLRTPWPINQALAATYVSMADLGSSLLNQYVFPFEVISVFLIAALIGAVVIAKKDKP
jgi:NADH:ubiquinone oxidoreductase subunit 6 (subunit J)